MTERPHVHTIRALDGANPLYFLAGLGILALLDDDAADRAAPNRPALSWAYERGQWAGVLRCDLDAEAFVETVTAHLERAGRVQDADAVKTAQREIRDASAEIKKRRRAIAETRKRHAKRPDFDPQRLAETTRDDRESLRHSETSYDLAVDALCDGLGAGPAHFGDIIAMRPEVFRRAVDRAERSGDVSRGVLRQLSALGSDLVESDGGLIEPTPFSFSNGASGQCLLKDFRGLVSALDKGLVRGFLLDGGRATKRVTSLNWEPNDLRMHAYQASAPDEDKTPRTDVVANALAYLGLGVCTVFPNARSTALLAVGVRSRAFQWVLWSPPLDLTLARALLAHTSDDRAEWLARGIAAAFESTVVNPTGKRKYFAPAVAR
ncbi:MAG: hypothetical protein KC766_18675 [Myxococcales bacterium]|nr:hypothetical protein [Myxococcales bacterium]